MKTVKFKHNKKRNSAFLYEALIKELTNSILKKDQKKADKIKEIIKHSFKKGTHLKNDLDSYRALYETNNVSLKNAEKLIKKSVENRKNNVDDEKLFQEQTALIKKINSQLGTGVYNNFTPNYRNLATIFQFFNKTTSVKNKVLLENKIVNLMNSKSHHVGKIKPVDSLSYSIFIKKFNEKYANSLLENQKKLINLFLRDDTGNLTELRVFLNQEISNLSEKIDKICSNEEDAERKSKFKLVKEALVGFTNERISHDMLKKILNIQGLVHEAINHEN